MQVSPRRIDAQSDASSRAFVDGADAGGLSASAAQQGYSTSFEAEESFKAEEKSSADKGSQGYSMSFEAAPSAPEV